MSALFFASEPGYLASIGTAFRIVMSIGSKLDKIFTSSLLKAQFPIPSCQENNNRERQLAELSSFRP